MSNLSFADFAAQLQAAQTAIDRIPALEAERDAALHQRDTAQGHAETLELRIIDYKSQTESLTAKLREVETERDTFRNEATHLTAVRDRLVSAFTAASDMVGDEIRQVVPQPEPTPESQQDPFAPSTSATTPDAPASAAQSGGATTTNAPSDPEPTKFTSWGSITNDWMDWKRRQSSDHADDGKPQSQSTGYGEERKSYTGQGF